MSHIQLLIAAAVVSMRVLAPSAQETKPSDEVRSLMAPTGTLRIGLYAGNPSSLLEAQTGFRTGVGFELGLALSRSLDIAIEPVIYPNNGAVLEGLRAGNVDVVFTNATPARAKEIDFAQACTEVEAGYIVAAGSKITAITAVDASGVRVGVMEGSTSVR